MRRSLSAVFFAASAFSALAVPAAASTMTTDLGAFSSGIFHKHFGDDVTSSFVDYYNFSITGPAFLSASVTNSYFDSTDKIAGFSLSLYGGTSATPGPLLTSVMASTDPGQLGTFTINEAFGSYFLKVTGTTTSASYGGSLALNVSPVPLPAALPMFGAALLVTFGLSFGIRRRGPKAGSALIGCG